MSQHEKQCVYCKAKLFSDDEVVYCPVCGAPHHKDCYNESGHCALEHFHGTADEYDPHPENKETDGEIHRDRKGHTCRRCEKMSSADTIFCPYCGAPFIEAQQNGEKNPSSEESEPLGGRTMPFGDKNGPFGETGTPFMLHIDLMGGVDKKEKIDGIEAGELASFVRVNTRRYMPLFKAMDGKKSKAGWNWSAFLFPCAWNAYRKNYMAAGVLLAVLLSAFYLVSSLVFALNSYIGTLPVDVQVTPSVIFDAYATVTPMHWVIFGAGIIIDFVSRIISAIYGDYWYKERVCAKFKEIKTDDEIDNKDEVLRQKGGVNQWLGMFALYPSVIMIYQCGSLIFQVIVWLLTGGM